VPERGAGFHGWGRCRILWQEIICSNLGRIGMPKALTLLVAIGLAGACARGGEGYNVSEPQPGDSGLAAVVVAEGLESPLLVTAPAGDDRLFIVERPGRIRILRSGQLLDAPYLDIVDRVGTGGERGLLGLAFHPDFAANGYFYINYSDRDGNTRVERYSAGADPDHADPASAKLVIAIDQPYANHNGGMIAFGPDGMLFIGMGDGGSGNDPHGNGQNRATLLGAMLRLDVNGGDPYAIPPDNPFVGQAEARGEIWAVGLRNPWRFSFERGGSILYIADVGQNAWEEIDIVDGSQAGLNFGWSVMEGTHCLGSASCDQVGLTLPVVEYGHDQGCSVIGGYVYRGSALAGLAGHYFYSDWCRGWLRSFRVDGAGAVTEHTEWPVGDIGNPLGFGEDADGELYVASQDGRVYRLERAP
jgi:glucose/arabinose dehydrogenase